MKIKLISLISITLFALAAATFGRGGGGGGFGGGGFGGGGHFGGGGFRSAPAFQPGGFGGVRYSFGARPMYGRPVYVRPQTSVARSRTNTFAGRQNSVGASNNRATVNSRSNLRGATARPTESARSHIVARHDATWHRDWDRRSAHHWNGHWWAWDGGAWIGLDAGYYPWDYFPYYAYDYYPYDYYPGYYADVEPYYYSDGVPDGVAAPDPTVKAVQTDLANRGYYHGPIDSLYGRTTRDAVARYQSERHFSVTGTLTRQTLQSLGLSSAVSS